VTNAHYYVGSNRPNTCIFCGGPPDHPDHPRIAPFTTTLAAPTVQPCPDCLELANLILNATYMTQPKDGHVRADREALRQPLKQFIKERE